jgi:Flp pilus assembly protein TadG
MNLRKIIQRHFGRFQRDPEGTSAIEFALIAPMLLAALVGLADVTTIAYGSSNMQSAVRAGIHYAMAGGTDATVAQSQADAAWTKKPSGGAVTASRVCKCATVTWDCDTICPDLARPEMYMTVTATASLGGNFYSLAQTSSETVRVR